MKAKVLTYTKDWNNLTYKHLEIEQIQGCSNAYLYIDKSDVKEYEKQHHIIVSINNVFFIAQTVYGCPDNYIRDTTQELIDGYTNKLFSKDAVLTTEKYVRKLEQEVTFLAGIISKDEYQLVNENRIQVVKKQEDAHRERERIQREEGLERDRQIEEKEAEKVQSAESNFLKGEKIAGEMFVKICSKNGIDIPLRTKGMLCDEHRIHGLSKESYWYGKKKGQNAPDFSSCEKAKNELLDKLAAL